MGNYLEDPPVKLLEGILENIKEYAGSVDAISIAGDFVVHGLCNSDPNHANWPKMKDVLTAVVEAVKKEFPGVPIIPTIGNNDLLNHYEAPRDDQKSLFYGDVYDIWFGNSRPEVEATFKEGGYYRIDLKDRVSFLSLNSILLNSKNSQNVTLQEAG
jgi:hypothetical protein